LLHLGLRKVLPDVLGPRVGARPLKRDIQARIENSVAKLILQAISFT
jgi:ATP-dependent Clp protease ATP-binding subunit ClpA